VARTAASLHSLSGGRVDVGLGVGGKPGEHHALGLPFPDVAERVARVEEAAQVMRLLWAGGPATFIGRFYELVDAQVSPVAPPPRLVVAGQTPAGARLAARAGDAWTTYAQDLDRLLPVYREASATGATSGGGPRADAQVLVSMDLVGPHAAAAEAFLADPVAETERWRERGADELILSYARPVHIPALLDAAARAGLAARYEDAR
jgi:alkanesulfonate monooxygenase SsuD/methylene tetrahydromethanopterin reductase-like flavin-dependent oxidoreductase (luciferase family)